MAWVNYHSHSLFCDGKAAAEEFVQAAVEKNFHAYGYSSHAPVSFPSVWNMNAGKLSDYLHEIRRIRQAYAGIIQVYAGLELDYIHGRPSYPVSELKAMGLDFIIGSVHYINCFPDGTHFCFDGQPEAFFKGIDIIYGNDFRKAITAYFHDVRQMIENDCPDIIGHMDKIKMHSTVQPYFNEDDAWYRVEVKKTLDLMAASGCVLEINTRGLYKHNPPMLYPSEWVIEEAFRRDIPVMINSDAHHPLEIESGFTQAGRLLHDIGYKTLRVMLDNSWQDRPFNEQGLAD
jgi:histidinol-phosphatase (PHP family)